MFTGIVEETGTIVKITTSENSLRLELRARVTAENARLGDSVAVNGCCLTVVAIQTEDRGALLSFDLLQETWVRTSFSELKIGAIVNLERALRADGRLHGHFVTGHIDGIAEVLVFEKRGTDWLLEIAPLEEIKRYLVSKGTIAIDGISLTIAEVLDDRIRIWIIPHTHAVTALRERNVGSHVNIEADLLAKYVAQLIGSR